MGWLNLKLFPFCSEIELGNTEQITATHHAEKSIQSKLNANKYAIIDFRRLAGTSVILHFTLRDVLDRLIRCDAAVPWRKPGACWEWTSIMLWIIHLHTNDPRYKCMCLCMEMKPQPFVSSSNAPRHKSFFLSSFLNLILSIYSQSLSLYCMPPAYHSLFSKCPSHIPLIVKLKKNLFFCSVMPWQQLGY